MTFKDIASKYGTKFIFKKDAESPVFLIYMVINPAGFINSMYAIVDLKLGYISAMGEYDRILSSEVIILPLGL